MVIREVQPADNGALKILIRKILEEYDVPKTGSAYADSALDNMYEAYKKPKAVYYVVENEGTIIGGAGIAPLDNFTGNVCELQKMYFLKNARGMGLGSKLIKLCLESATKFGYEYCYLETVPAMTVAQKMYQKYGFRYLDAPMGDTGHSACPVWMIKNIF